MAGGRELVHSPCLLRPIPFLLKIRQISRQRLWIAGHIDHAVRIQDRYSIHEFFCASASRRIHKYHIGMSVLGGHLDHEFSGIVVVEADVFLAVCLRVCDGIPDGILV